MPVNETAEWKQRALKAEAELVALRAELATTLSAHLDLMRDAELKIATLQERDEARAAQANGKKGGRPKKGKS